MFMTALQIAELLKKRYDTFANGCTIKEYEHAGVKLSFNSLYDLDRCYYKLKEWGFENEIDYTSYEPETANEAGHIWIYESFGEDLIEGFILCLIP